MCVRVGPGVLPGGGLVGAGVQRVHPVMPLEGGPYLDFVQTGAPRKRLDGRLLIARVVTATRDTLWCWVVVRVLAFGRLTL